MGREQASKKGLQDTGPLYDRPTTFIWPSAARGELQKELKVAMGHKQFICKHST